MGRSVVRVGNEWVAADDAGWTDEVYASEDEAWEAVGGKPMERHDIAWAINKMHWGHGVYRRGWNSVNQAIYLQTPDENSKMTQPYVYIVTPKGDLVPWLCSQADLLAEDWELYS